MPIFEGNIEQGSATHAVAVTANDSSDFSFGQCRALYVGVAGDITLDTRKTTNVLFKNVPVGILPVAAVRVRVTGTAAGTAAALVALY